MWHSNTCSLCTCNIGINSWAALFDSPFEWSIWSFPQTLSHINLLCSMTKSCDRGCLTKLLKAQQHKSNIVPRLLNSPPNSLMDPASAARGVWGHWWGYMILPWSCDHCLREEKGVCGVIDFSPSCRLEEHCLRSITSSSSGSQLVPG